MRRALLLLALAPLALAAAGCGGRFAMPTENRDRQIPSDKSYAIQATWTGMNGIRDILLTQGSGTQLFLLFNHGGTGTDPRGEVLSYARMKPDGPQVPLPGIAFAGLFNPVALCAGGDGAGHTANRIFVLDQGDTTMARVNPLTGVHGDTTGLSGMPNTYWMINNVSHLEFYPRVREYGLLGGDTLSTFVDTTMAFVNGIAADDQGRVYVSGAAIVWVPDALNPSLKTRSFVWHITRYARGNHPQQGHQYYMPGCNWYRDTTWVDEGSGLGTTMDPRGMQWAPVGTGGALYFADFGKNWAQKAHGDVRATGYWYVEQAENLSLLGPLDVAADPAGFLYVADTGSQRVLRFDDTGAYVQRVNVEGPALLSPATVAADDSLVFVGDPATAQVMRYKRRK